MGSVELRCFKMSEKIIKLAKELEVKKKELEQEVQNLSKQTS